MAGFGKSACVILPEYGSRRLSGDIEKFVMTNKHLLNNKGWIAGIVAVTTIAAFIYGTKLMQHLSSETVESRCMSALEATAQAARLKHPEQRAQAIFHTMATQDCKAYFSHAKS